MRGLTDLYCPQNRSDEEYIGTGATETTPRSTPRYASSLGDFSGPSD